MSSLDLSDGSELQDTKANKAAADLFPVSELYYLADIKKDKLLIRSKPDDINTFRQMLTHTIIC